MGWLSEKAFVRVPSRLNNRRMLRLPACPVCLEKPLAHRGLVLGMCGGTCDVSRQQQGTRVRELSCRAKFFSVVDSVGCPQKYILGFAILDERALGSERAACTHMRALSSTPQGTATRSGASSVPKSEDPNPSFLASRFPLTPRSVHGTSAMRQINERDRIRLGKQKAGSGAREQVREIAARVAPAP